jgi:hypothetical protein
VTAIQQGPGDMATDKTRAARDENGVAHD